MPEDAIQTVDEIRKLYTDTYRTKMPLYNDYVFHRIYGSDTEESRAALMGLLNIILERSDDPIKHVEIKNPVDYGELLKSKDTAMDIKAETESREILDIEMQVDHLEFYRNRSLFYGGRLVNSSLNSGEDYDKMKKSIVVSIIHTKLFPGDIGCHSVFNVRENDTGYLLTDRLELHFLELGKVNPDKSIEEMSQMEKLAFYLRYAADENYKDSVQKICSKEDGIFMAENLYRKATKEEREAAWAESRFYFQLEQNTIKARAIKQGLEEGRAKGLAEGRAKGLAEGRAEGRAEGAAREKREIAEKMLREGMSKATIAKITGLSPDALESL